MKTFRLFAVLAMCILCIAGVQARDLNAGMSGPDVKAWQLFLIKRGYMEPPALGNFGARTVQATIAFQKGVGLQGLGIVGSKTIAKAKKLGFRTVASSGNSSTNNSSDSSTSETNEVGPGLPLTEAFSDTYGSRALTTAPVFMPSRVGFSAMALISVNGQKLSTPYVLFYVFTAGSPKWTGKNNLMLSFSNRRLVLSGEKTTEPLNNSSSVFEKLRVRIPFSDFLALTRSGTFNISVGDATFGVSQRSATGLRALALKLSR